MGEELLTKVGVVVIGRNEGERLRQCLSAVTGIAGPVVYVDSGSTDGSSEMARKLRVQVVDLDARTPFTAARARNEGFRRAREFAPGLTYVQFVDGDCELVAGWLEKAVAFLEGERSVVAVCGKLRERFPDRSIYNMLCNIEWDRPAGEARACGGIFMIRVDAFESARGFRADLIAGEEPELCVRLRASGWQIWRIAQEMALHDAAMSHFGQWWRRAVRGGHAFAQGVAMHGASPERYGIRESCSAWFWALGVPLAVTILASSAGWWALAVLMIYPLQVVRLTLHGDRMARENWWCALFLVLGKFAQFLGQLRFLAQCILGRQSRLIEYK